MTTGVGIGSAGDDQSQPTPLSVAVAAPMMALDPDQTRVVLLGIL